MTSTTIPLYRRILYLSIPFLFVLLVLVGIEVGTRLFMKRVSSLELMIQPTALRPNLAGEIDESIFTGDPWLFWRIKPYVKQAVWNFTMVTTTNNLGVRHVGDIGRKKPGAFRMVCLGDSVSFGYRVPLVFPEHPDGYAPSHEPYALLLERVLRQANPGKEIEVLPLAVPAYTSFQGMTWLKRDIDFLKPDVVVACFGWNDIGLRTHSDKQVMLEDWTHLSARWLMCHSQVLTHIAHWRQAKKLGGDPHEKALAEAASAPRSIPRVSETEYVDNMLEMARIARAHNAQPVFIASIYRDTPDNESEAGPMRKYREALRVAAEKNGILFFQTKDLGVGNFANNSGLFGDPIHPNGTGHEVLTNELLQFFKDHDTLKPLTVPTDIKWH